MYEHDCCGKVFVLDPSFKALLFLQAQHLVQIGADIDARDKQRLSTLHFAASHGHLDLVSFLWSKGAEIDWESPGEFPDLAGSVSHSCNSKHSSRGYQCCQTPSIMCTKCRWQISLASGSTQGSQQRGALPAQQAGLG